MTYDRIVQGLRDSTSELQNEADALRERLERRLPGGRPRASVH